jgi:hypothetical protein
MMGGSGKGRAKPEQAGSSSGKEAASYSKGRVMQQR